MYYSQKKTHGSPWTTSLSRNISLQCRRSIVAKDVCLTVPGYHTPSTNIMAKIWNAVPGLQDASTLGAARALSQKWTTQIPRRTTIASLLKTKS